MLTAEDNVIITNQGDKPWIGMYGGKRYGCPPGQAVHIPFALAVKDFGDPRSGPKDHMVIDDVGNKLKIPSRKQELDRLHVLYGVQAENLDRVQNGEAPTATLASKAPKVTISDWETGQQIPMVLTDPAGDSAMPIPIQEDAAGSAEARMAVLQRQIDQLRAQVENERRATAEGAAEGTGVQEDAPALV